MPYKRKFSDEELLEIRRKNGRKGSEVAKANAAANGTKLGRPPLTGASKAIPVKTIQVHESAHSVFSKVATAGYNISIIELMDRIADSVKENHKELFSVGVNV